MRKQITGPIWVLLFLLALIPFETHAQTGFPLDTVRSRAARQALWFPAENKTIPQILALMNSNGSFSDRGSDLYILQYRIRKMAQAYYADPAYQGSNSLKNSIYKAWKYWFDNAQPGSRSWGDWTRTDLFLPRWLGLTSCLMHAALRADRGSNPDAAAIHSYINTYYNNYVWGSTNGRTESLLGANLSSRLVGAMSLAAYLNDTGKAARAQDTVASVLRKGAGTQTQAPNYPHTGLTTDYGWHQHCSQGGQMLWGNYGLVFLSDMTFYTEIVGGSQWDLSAAQYQEIYTSIKEGMELFLYKTTMDLSVAGRIVLNPQKYGQGRQFGNLMRELARRATLSPHGFTQAQYNELMDLRLRSIDPNRPQVVSKSKFFFASDMLVHARTDNHLVVRMCSRRTGAKELGIGYPTLNYHMADGATYFRIDGMEYLEARLGMNYTSIPGTTCEQKTGQPTIAGANTMNSANDFAGGLSDGTHTLGAFQYDRSHPYSSIHANKGYFIFDDAFAFLGSKIQQVGTASGETWTTLNQAERRGEVTYDTGTGKRRISLSTNTQRDFNNISQISWFHHDDIGYIIIPNGGVDLKLWAEVRSRRWRDIDQSNSDNSLRNVNMFQLSINHQRNPQNEDYEYIVIPNVTALQTESIANNLPVQILKHSQNAQVVYKPSVQLCQAVFYSANQNFNTPWGFGVRADKAATMMLRSDSTKVYLSVSDPRQVENQITITLDGEYSGPGVTYNASVNESEVVVNMPRGIYGGQQVDLVLTAGNTPGFLPVELLDFQAEYIQENNSVSLDWFTANESNSHYFELRRSPDGTSFDEIGNIQAAGNSQEVVRYSFVDKDPLPGRNYYQLKMVDQDGSFEYSKTIETYTPDYQKSALEVYPNPLTRGESLNLKIHLPNSFTTDLSVLDLQGRLIEKVEGINLDLDGNTWFELDTSSWQKGVYLLILEGSQGIYNKKLVVR
ncbi:MAG: polysaccharide lyase beta-sandwich domain-containing protein [Bacteroidia bacterium]|nr:polysaccharide lyase beta-sandwich domain-containing protein [Bacteroidia bacterium]